MLRTRQLGKDGPQVTALGWGAMNISCTDAERLDFIDQVYNRGSWNWDTSEGYADSEVMIGKWFAQSGKRDDIFLATKFGIRLNSDGSRVLRNDPEYIRMAIDRSLERLQTDHVDLWYCHRFSGEVPVEIVVGAMAEAVKYVPSHRVLQTNANISLTRAGKVKYLGLSECSSATLRRAYKIHPISAVQIEYSPFTMDIEDPKIGLLETCRELGVAVVAYSPLGRGMLTGQYRSNQDFGEDDFRRTMPRFSDANFPKNLELVDALKAIADRKGITTGQLTLAWLMKQGEDIIPIPGTKRVKYLEENLASLNVSLTAEEEREIRAMVEQAETSGERYPANMMKYNFMDTPPLE
ncbi:MAG: hypothetical protein LQ352_005735 [Teloschistes flavicans]|nr:MAG: hypothetical protein LQ352_005735 [Teloschistes flavicans]